ncbi:MATE family efflux transporter [Deltaproteobacteria bacterium OttesenSCG-928-M10]|nr:MATE family efflux transporter [Deltaproteobacteria bacterium OttesenSCG-928-M10]
MSRLSNKQYLGVVLPFMFSTMTQPLMGAVNTAVMGQLPDPAYIAGVSLGAILFNTIYWLFGFLRVGTSGYAAQALGTGTWEDRVMSFCRPMVLAAVLSLLIIILQKPILQAFLGLVAPAPDVAGFTAHYYYILVWGAPFTLFNYVSLGWLMGQAKIKATLIMQVSSNVLNMVLCVLFVNGFGYDVAGVAVAALIAQGYGCLVGLILMNRHGGFRWWEVPPGILFKWRAFWSLMKTSGNLMFRTACLVTVNNLFAASGASFGTETLAANAVLLQIQYMLSYLIDGMGNSASLFVGRAVGRRDQELFEGIRIMSFKWLLVLAVFLSAGYGLGSDRLIAIFTDNPSVLALTDQYKAYVMIYPFCAGAGLVLYGMYTGATYTAPVRNMVILALTAFVVCRQLLTPVWGNHGLWLAYLAFYSTQSVFLCVFFRQLRRRTGFLKGA